MQINELIKIHRLRKGLTMEQLAQKIGADKGMVSRWESGKQKPSPGNLKELSEILETELIIKQDQAVQVFNTKIMEIPLVDQYAYAGYLSNYNNHTYMEELPKIPFFVDHLGKGNYLAFEVRGDSMTDGSHESILDGDILMSREINKDHWRSRLHINKWLFVIVHETDGILIKKITNHDIEKGVITIHSLNDQYQDEQINLNEVKQLFNVIKIERKI